MGGHPGGRVLATIVVALTLVAPVVLPAGRALGAGILPPANPPASIPFSAALSQACSSVPVTAACVSQAVPELSRDRAAEGVGPMSLPSNFLALTVNEQNFVVANLERVDRGLVPAQGLSAVLDGYAQQGALADTDPPPDDTHASRQGANWVSTANPLLADELFVYDDGPGGTNLDCTAASTAGCWVHRDNVLLAVPQLIMGAGDATSDPDHGSLTQLFAAGDTTNPTYFTWASEASLGPVGLSPSSLTLGAAAGASVAATVTATASGEDMTLTQSVTGDPAFSVTPSSCGLVAAGNSCAITVRFSPTAVGAAGATLTVVGPNGPATVGLSGETNPAAPAGIAASGLASAVQVSWSAAINGGSAITAYRIWRSTAPGVSGTVIVTLPGLAATYTDHFVTPGTSYYYAVQALNAVGASSLGSQTPAVPQAPPPFPSQPPAPPQAPGYWMVGAAGQVYGFGGAGNDGSPAIPAGASAVDVVSTPSGRGYWVVDSRGDVWAYGDAAYLGGGPALGPGEAVTSLSATGTGRGYWLFTTLGRVVAYGDAPFLGDMAGAHLNGPVLGSVATPDGRGYYLVASDGGIFTFGDAVFEGSMGGRPLNRPVVGLAPNPAGPGYWLVASDGGIFSFGPPFLGSMGGAPLNRPVIGMAAYGNGYLMVASDGGIFDFSSLAFAGSLGGNPPADPIVAVGPVV